MSNIKVSFSKKMIVLMKLNLSFDQMSILEDALQTFVESASDEYELKIVTDMAQKLGVELNQADPSDDMMVTPAELIDDAVPVMDGVIGEARKVEGN